MSASVPPPSRVSRASGLLLAALLIVHLVLAAMAVANTSLALRSTEFDLLGLSCSFLACIVVFGAAMAWWPRCGHRIFFAAALSVAMLLFRPGPVFTVAAMLLNAFVVGEWVLLGRGQRASGVLEGVSVTSTMLVGVSVWTGLIALAATIRLHSTAIYVAALALPLVFGWRRALSVVSRLRMALLPGPAPLTERAWWILLMTITALHLIVVAKPDVGYDAATMHLHLPMLVEQQHRWSQDLTRYLWAVMPLGGDFSYLAAYLLGGEAAARLINLCFGAAACHFVFVLVRRHAGRDVAFACVCLIASSPLAYLETGTLYVENLWLAYLLGALVAALRLFDSAEPEDAVACAFLSAGAMQTKVIGIVWLAPLLLVTGYACVRRRHIPRLNGAQVASVLVAIAFAAWPYANAWVRTGNPIFPFMNGVFRSRFFDSGGSFFNERYLTPLQPWSVYETLLESGRFIEGWDGAAGFHLFLLLAALVWGFTRKRDTVQWCCLGLALFFFAAVFSQQSYLRYLLPAFTLLAVLGSWALADLPSTRSMRAAVLVVGAFACILNLSFMVAASNQNATLCLTCAYDADRRREYVEIYMPERLVGRYLNDSLPRARVGFFVLNGPGASDYVGYSRAANWHDADTYPALLRARSADDVLAIARRRRLTHVVVPAADASCPIEVEEQRSVNAFRDRYTAEIWRIQCLAVATIVAPPPP